MKTILVLFLFASLSIGAEPVKDKSPELPRYVLTAMHFGKLETFELGANNAEEAKKKLDFFYHVSALTVKTKEQELLERNALATK